MLRNYLFTFLIVLMGCASTMTPEQKLAAGYDAASASVRSTTALVSRDAISVKAGRAVSDMAKATKVVLDEGTEQLAACRAKVPPVSCDEAVKTIDLGFGVMMSVETYLEEHK